MLQFQMALIDSQTSTGVQMIISTSSIIRPYFRRFDHIMMDRIRGRGIAINFLFIMIHFTNIYFDATDLEIRDTDEILFERPTVNDIFEP